MLALMRIVPRVYDGQTAKLWCANRCHWRDCSYEPKTSKNRKGYSETGWSSIEDRFAILFSRKFCNLPAKKWPIRRYRLERVRKLEEAEWFIWNLWQILRLLSDRLNKITHRKLHQEIAVILLRYVKTSNLVNLIKCFWSLPDVVCFFVFDRGRSI